MFELVFKCTWLLSKYMLDALIWCQYTPYLENIYPFENCTLSDVDCSSTVLY